MAVPHWIWDDEAESNDGSWIEELRAHEGVREKSFGHISSFSFSPKVFYKGSWDDINVKARGLFVNNRTGDVVARSYDKFFNVGEREETQIDNILKNVQYPVTVYVKENGYLGVTGYDAQEDRVFIASKSTPEGDFADNFKRMMGEHFGGVGLERLKRFMRDTESSFVFEVIDPVFDPHIIEYEEEKLVLLDVIHRAPEFDKLAYDGLKVVSKDFNLPHKEHALTFGDERSLRGWYDSLGDMGKKFKGKHLEGFVLEDANGFQTKIKLPYYSFWKQMRSFKDRLVKHREKGVDLKFRLDPNWIADVDRAKAFYAWSMEQDSSLISQDIIKVRSAFEEEFQARPDVLMNKWEDVEKSQKRKSRSREEDYSA